jgi:SRSO17 transposase
MYRGRTPGSWPNTSGTGRPTGWSGLLNGAKWDADALRDRVRDYVVATLGAEDGVLIADDTPGDQEGGQVGRGGAAALRGDRADRELPGDADAQLRLGARARLHRSGAVPAPAVDRRPAAVRAGRVPVERGFATKPELVIDMLDRALAAGVPFRYFTADSGYGRDPADQLGTDEPHREPVATTRPREASIPGHPLRRQNPRQEPRALAAHAGICAGGRP